MRTDVRSRRFQDGETVWKTVDQWGSTYWTGLDAKVYAGDIYLDELVAVQYEMQEMVMPVYSYASYTYDTTIRGARRIQGVFTINYKRESYIYEMLSAISRKPVILKGEKPTKKDESSTRVAASQTATLEDFTALTTKGSVTGNRKTRTKEEVARLRSVATAFREAGWGQAENPALRSELVNLAGPKFDSIVPLDITVKFDSSNTNSKETGNTKMGEKVPNSNLGVVLTTAFRIIGVEITGVGKVLDDSGRPILESYSFIAKDVV